MLIASGVFGSGALNVNWCNEKVVRKVWSYADELQLKQSKITSRSGQESVSKDNNSQKNSLALDVLQLAADVACNSDDCEMDNFDKVRTARN